MKTAVLDSFLKFYVMISTQVDLFGIYHVKVHFIAHQKMYVIPMLGRFVWTTFLYNVAFWYKIVLGLGCLYTIWELGYSFKNVMTRLDALYVHLYLITDWILYLKPSQGFMNNKIRSDAKKEAHLQALFLLTFLGCHGFQCSKDLSVK